MISLWALLGDLWDNERQKIARDRVAFHRAFEFRYLPTKGFQRYTPPVATKEPVCELCGEPADILCFDCQDGC